jgi:hypothetical protein
MSEAEPRYPDDYEILHFTGRGATVSLSAVSFSSCSLAMLAPMDALIALRRRLRLRAGTRKPAAKRTGALSQAA